MEKVELIKELNRIKNDINYQIRIKEVGTKIEKRDAEEELKLLSNQAIQIYKEHSILDLTHPNRNKEYDSQWFGELYGKGGVHDINMAILHLEKKII